MEKKVKLQHTHLRYEEAHQAYQPHPLPLEKLARRRKVKKERFLEKMQCVDQSIKIEAGFSRATQQKPKEQRLGKHLLNQYQVQRMIKFRVSEKVIDIANKVLFPVLMGPHPIYTVQLDNCRKARFESVDLRQKLTQWIRLYLTQKNLLKKKRNKAPLVHQNSEQEKSEKLVQKTQTKKISSRVGSTYNKYSLDFKKSVVKRIQMRMEEESTNAKSLRHYISEQAKSLNIHPKNILRWFDTNDLDRKEGGRKAKYPILEFRLANFVKENHNCKRREIIKQAKRILTELGGDQAFNFSKGWYERFKNRLKDDKVSRSMQRILYDGEREPKCSLKPQQVQTGANEKYQKQSDQIYNSDEEERNEETLWGQCKVQETNEKVVKIQHNEGLKLNNDQYFFESQGISEQKFKYLLNKNDE